MNNYSIKTEIFKDIEGYEGLYEISNAGTVKSLDRMTTRSDGRKRRFLGQVLSARKAGAGYEMIQLAKEGTKKHAYIHRLVAIAFVPNNDNKKEVNHIDGNKRNNNYTNLEWVTPSENKRHAYKLGLRSKVDVVGMKNGRAKLTESDVIAIRGLSASGKSYVEISGKFNIHPSTIGKIVKRKLWKNI